jgi:hypothetical protein
MRLVKLGLISVIVLFGLITLMSSLLPSHIRISRAIDIAAARGKIYQQVANFSQWEAWNEYVHAYHNKRIENSELKADEITVSFTGKTDSLLSTAWQQPGGKKFGSGFAIIAQDSNHTTVQWYFDFYLKWYPWEKFQSIVYDQQFGPLMEKTLANLKKITESAD